MGCHCSVPLLVTYPLETFPSQILHEMNKVEGPWVLMDSDSLVALRWHGHGQEQDCGGSLERILQIPEPREGYRNKVSLDVPLRKYSLGQILHNSMYGPMSPSSHPGGPAAAQASHHAPFFLKVPFRPILLAEEGGHTRDSSELPSVVRQ